MSLNALSICLTALLLSQAAPFEFKHTLECTEVGSQGCLSWNRSVSIAENLPIYSGFPANTYILTRKGPCAINDIQVGDLVMGLDPKTGHEGYSRVEAWLYRNPLVETVCISLTYSSTSSTSSNGSATSSIMASPLQNLAFIDASGKINYKFV